MLVLKNCRLVGALTKGYNRPVGNVLLDGASIAAIVPPDSEVPKEADVIDLEGKTLLPGLFDLHTHLYFKKEDIYALAATPAAEATFDCIESAQAKLAYGYTTLRDCGSTYNTAIATRDGLPEV